MDNKAIEQSTNELAKVLGAIFYVTTNMEEASPEYYALWVAVHRGVDLLDELKKQLGHGSVGLSVH